MDNWCKVQDALGEVFMSQYRKDCLQYMKQWNADNQILLSEQSMLDLFMGGIYKLDKLNEDHQQSSKPSPQPRLSGAFREGGSLVSPTILECIRIGLIKLTVEPALRNMTVFKDVPILLATYEGAPRSSPSPNRDGRHSRGQLHIDLPPAHASVVHGTELQIGVPRSALRRDIDHAPPDNRTLRREQFDRDSRNATLSLPPAPRFGNVLQQHELMSGEDIREQRLLPLFKAEPLLDGKCLARFQSLSVTLPAGFSEQGKVVSSIHSTQDCYYQVRSRWSDARPVAPTSHDAKRRHQGTPEKATEERTQAGPRKWGNRPKGERPLSAREGLQTRNGWPRGEKNP